MTLTDQALSYLRSSSSSLLSALFSPSSQSTTRARSRSPNTASSPWQEYLETYLLAPLSSISTLLTSPSTTTNPTNRGSSSNSSSTTTTDILTAFIVLATLFLTLKLANYLRRLVMWWVFFLAKIALMYALAVVGWSVWTRGLEVTMRDVGVTVGFLEGLGTWVGRELVGDVRAPGGRGGGGGGYGGYGSGYGYARGREQVPIPTRGPRSGGWV